MTSKITVETHEARVELKIATGPETDQTVETRVVGPNAIESHYVYGDRVITAKEVA